MKFQSKLTLIGSMAALVASPIAFAGKDGGKASAAVEEAADPAPVDNDEVITVEDDVPVDDGAAEPDHGGKGGQDEEVTDGNDGEAKDGDVVDEDVELSDPGDSETVEDGGDGAVPIDWVKRGGVENPDVMFFNTAGGPSAPVFKEDTSALARELGKDDKAAAIDTKDNAVSPQIKGEKKAPVALIKKGRVFLR